jgi:hypothetical protein
MFDFIFNLFKATESVHCTICDYKTTKISKLLTCEHKYCRKCINKLQKYKPGDFVESFKHQCPECQKPLIMKTNRYNDKISCDGHFNTKYDDKKYYRFCKKCAVLFDAGDKSCQIDKKILTQYCIYCDPNIRNQVCRCGYTLELLTGCAKVQCPKCYLSLCFVHNKTQQEIITEIKRLKESQHMNDIKLYNYIYNNGLGSLFIRRMTSVNYNDCNIIYACPWCYKDNIYVSIYGIYPNMKQIIKEVIQNKKRELKNTYIESVYV